MDTMPAIHGGLATPDQIIKGIRWTQFDDPPYRLDEHLIPNAGRGLDAISNISIDPDNIIELSGFDDDNSGARDHDYHQSLLGRVSTVKGDIGWGNPETVQRGGPPLYRTVTGRDTITNRVMAMLNSGGDLRTMMSGIPDDVIRGEVLEVLNDYNILDAAYGGAQHRLNFGSIIINVMRRLAPENSEMSQRSEYQWIVNGKAMQPFSKQGLALDPPVRLIEPSFWVKPKWVTIDSGRPPTDARAQIYIGTARGKSASTGRYYIGSIPWVWSQNPRSADEVKEEHAQW